MENSDLFPIKIDLITRNGCRAGARTERILLHLSQYYDGLELRVFNVSDEVNLPENRQAFITPGIWINDRLWCLGGVQVPRLRRKLEKLAPGLWESNFDWEKIDAMEDPIESPQDVFCT